MDRIARRMAGLGTETAFEILARAKALEAKGRDIVHLEIGEPDFDTPDNIIDAAAEALHGGFTHYGPSAGLPLSSKPLRERMYSVSSEPVNEAVDVLSPVIARDGWLVDIHS